eukprot:3888434-Amphidinium_carterae.1
MKGVICVKNKDSRVEEVAETIRHVLKEGGRGAERQGSRGVGRGGCWPAGQLAKTEAQSSAN